MTSRRRPGIAAQRTAPLSDDVDSFIRRANAWIIRRSVVVLACPIVTEQDVGARREQIGSGVLFEEDGETYFITAAHVGDWCADGKHVLAIKASVGTGKPIPIVGTKMISTPTPPERRGEDRVDIAVFHVPAPASAELRATCDIVRWEDLDVTHEPRADDRIGVCGIPIASPWSTQREDGDISYESLSSAVGRKLPVPAKLLAAAD